MEFIKNGDLINIIKDGKDVGIIKIKRHLYSQNIEGYSISFNTEVLGYGFGGFAKNYKNAKKVAEINYSKLQEHIKKYCSYYDEEINMYFRDIELYNNFKTTPIYKNIINNRQQ